MHAIRSEYDDADSFQPLLNVGRRCSHFSSSLDRLRSSACASASLVIYVALGGESAAG